MPQPIIPPNLCEKRRAPQGETIQSLVVAQIVEQQLDGGEVRAGIAVLVTRPIRRRKSKIPFDLDICFGSRHIASIWIFFLQLRQVLAASPCYHLVISQAL